MTCKEPRHISELIEVCYQKGGMQVDTGFIEFGDMRMTEPLPYYDLVQEVLVKE